MPAAGKSSDHDSGRRGRLGSDRPGLKSGVPHDEVKANGVLPFVGLPRFVGAPHVV